MKDCPFCAEQIQDSAIKCRHCGEIVVSEQFIQDSEQYSSGQESKPLILRLSMFIGTALYIAFGIFSIVKAAYILGISVIALGVAFYLIAPIGWKCGDLFLNFVRPSLYFANGVMDLAQKRLFWTIGPQMIGVGVCFLLPIVLSSYITYKFDESSVSSEPSTSQVEQKIPQVTPPKQTENSEQNQSSATNIAPLQTTTSIPAPQSIEQKLPQVNTEKQTGTTTQVDDSSKENELKTEADMGNGQGSQTTMAESPKKTNDNIFRKDENNPLSFAFREQNTKCSEQLIECNNYIENSSNEMISTETSELPKVYNIAECFQFQIDCEGNMPLAVKRSSEGKAKLDQCQNAYKECVDKSDVRRVSNIANIDEIRNRILDFASQSRQNCAAQEKECEMR